jgi:cysteine-rich repeat protein
MRQPGGGIGRCLLAVTATLAGIGAWAEGPRFAEELLDGRIATPAGVFESWAAYAQSAYFRDHALRCGTRAAESAAESAAMAAPAVPADCSLGQTNPAEIYDPAVARYQIPVVVHVIQSSSGSGFISAAKVQSQIDILNEDFLALAGTNGGLGNDAQIQFALATEDPAGNPTTGITYSTNNTWFNDGGGYYNTLAWDTHRYLNIYTNTAGGALGYVPSLPQGGLVGQKQDRVVILWSAFGRDGVIGPPFDQGRTATHEVGHYLGLYHTFDNGCGTVSGCYTTGDRICDTPRESDPSFGCPTGKATCGDDDPQENYMDYSDDLCMTKFTPEQNRRMRCSIESYRPNLYTTIAGTCGNDALDPDEQCDDGNLLGGDGCDLFCRLEAAPSEVSPAESPVPLVFSDRKTLRWEPAATSRADTFNVYRAQIQQLALGVYGTCLLTDVEEPMATVPFNPPAGSGWSFLVSGVNVYGEGTLGQSSTGDERTSDSPCP